MGSTAAVFRGLRSEGRMGEEVSVVKGTEGGGGRRLAEGVRVNLEAERVLCFVGCFRALPQKKRVLSGSAEL